MAMIFKIQWSVNNNVYFLKIFFQAFNHIKANLKKFLWWRLIALRVILRRSLFVIKNVDMHTLEKDVRGEERRKPDKEGGDIHLVSAQTQIRCVYGMEVGSEGGHLLQRCKCLCLWLEMSQDLAAAAWLRIYHTLKYKLQKKKKKKEGKKVERHLRWSVSAQGRQWIVRHDALVMVINLHANPNLFKTD